MIPIATMS